MHYKDKQFFASCLLGPASPHLPRASHKVTWWYRSAWRAKRALNAMRRLVSGDRSLMEGIR